MSQLDAVLGLDFSTQGLAACILDRRDFSLISRASLRYRDEAGLAGFRLGEVPILPPREPGEADQPAGLFLAALDILLSRMGREGPGFSRVAAINLSAQQHGHVYLNARGLDRMAALADEGAGAALEEAGGLAAWFADGFASERAPIWMSSNAAPEAAEIREKAGGLEAMLERSGSDSPARFSAAIARRIAKRQPELWAATARIHLLSSFLSGVLAAESDAPIDWGNGSGVSLMNWRSRVWDPALLAAAGAGLPGGGAAFASRLPPLAHPLAIVGPVAAWLRERHGFPADCAVVAGSGDNPQSYVLAEGSLLSLGTSFVLMEAGCAPLPGYNAMYDGLGRPFVFGCRSNGALTWERARIRLGMGASDFAAADRALAAHAPGSSLAIFQPEAESFPLSPAMELGLGGPGDSEAERAGAYAGVVDSSLGAMVLAGRGSSGAEIAVTGGAAASLEVVRRVATLWGRRARPIAEAGAAAGAALAAACALEPVGKRAELLERARPIVAAAGEAVEPDRAAAAALRAKGGYFERLKTELDRAAGR